MLVEDLLLPSAPSFDRGYDERGQHVDALSKCLSQIIASSWTYSCSVTLFETAPSFAAHVSDVEGAATLEMPFEEWSYIAARSCVLSTRDFIVAHRNVGNELRQIPDWLEAIGEKTVGQLTQRAERLFPDSRDIRDAVCHSEEYTERTTVAGKKLSGKRHRKPGVRADLGESLQQMRQNVIVGRTFQATKGNRLVTCDITTENAKMLVKIVRETLDLFRPFERDSNPRPSHRQSMTD